MVSLKNIYVLIFLLIISCSSTLSQKDINEHVDKIISKNSQQISSWDISGVILVRNKNKSWHAIFNWLQRNKNNYQIRLFAPFGGSVILITCINGLITYNDGKHIDTNHNAALLLQQKTGMFLPINHLYYWVRGLPVSQNILMTQYDKEHNLKLLKQLGYVIEYNDYMSDNNYILPKQLKIYNNNLMVKIMIEKWQINQ